MASKITMHTIKNIIAVGATTGTTYSKSIRGKILSIKILYSNTTPVDSSDRDTNLFEMNPGDPTSLTNFLQEVLNIGSLGAAPTTDNNIYYPRTPCEDKAGTSLKYLSTDAAIVPTEYVVFGRLMLSVTAAAAGDITTAYIMVEEY